MSVLRQLANLINNYNLEARDPYWVNIRMMLEFGRLRDDRFAEMLFFQAREAAERIKDKGLFLARPPKQEELYRGKEPDIEIGSLIEGEQFRLGLDLEERPRNILITGSAGFGKSTAIRKICEKVNERNNDEFK